MRKKQEKLERFLLEPQYTPLFGITVTKDTVVLIKISLPFLVFFS